MAVVQRVCEKATSIIFYLTLFSLIVYKKSIYNYIEIAVLPLATNEGNFVSYETHLI